MVCVRRSRMVTAPVLCMHVSSLCLQSTCAHAGTFVLWHCHGNVRVALRLVTANRVTEYREDCRDRIRGTGKYRVNHRSRLRIDSTEQATITNLTKKCHITWSLKMVPWLWNMASLQEPPLIALLVPSLWREIVRTFFFPQNDYVMLKLPDN